MWNGRELACAMLLRWKFDPSNFLIREMPFFGEIHAVLTDIFLDKILQLIYIFGLISPPTVLTSLQFHFISVLFRCSDFLMLGLCDHDHVLTPKENPQFRCLFTGCRAAITCRGFGPLAQGRRQTPASQWMRILGGRLVGGGIYGCIQG